jgi:hypothetical protein
LVSEPATPDPNKLIIWASALDGLIYQKDQNGIVKAIGSGVSGATAYSALTDVNTTGLTVGQAMIWNGTVWIPGARREVLTANRTYYVRTDGNDNNNGLSNTAGGAFRTIQKAIDVVASLDIAIYNVIIELINGDYTDQNILVIQTPIGSGQVTITGNISDKTLVQIPQVSMVNSSFLKYTISNVYINVSNNNTALTVDNATLTVNNCRIKNISTSGFSAKIRSDNKANILFTGPVEIEGNTTGGYCFFLFGHGYISLINKIITMIGNPSLTNVYYVAGLSFCELGGSSISGSYSGTLYTKEGGGIIRGPAYTYV